jgi:hypothetical protein
VKETPTIRYVHATSNVGSLPSFLSICLSVCLGAVDHHPLLSKDGEDIAARILHNRIVTPQQLHQWSKQDTDYCPWCPGTTGTIDNMCSTAPQSQLLEPFSQDTPQITRTPPAAEETYTVRLYHPTTTRQLPAGTSQTNK